MSGGEKSATIHMPLFAAANALYSSAKPTCPRLVALDEAFAGIDDKFKPELLGLTVRFDLDLFMTGHDLWVTFPTVPAIAHYDLEHDKARSHGVGVSRGVGRAQLIDAERGYAGNEELASGTARVPAKPACARRRRRRAHDERWARTRAMRSLKTRPEMMPGEAAAGQ